MYGNTYNLFSGPFYYTAAPGERLAVRLTNFYPGELASTFGIQFEGQPPVDLLDGNTGNDNGWYIPPISGYSYWLYAGKVFDTPTTNAILANNYIEGTFSFDPNYAATSKGLFFAFYLLSASAGGDPHITTFAKNHFDIKAGTFSLFNDKRLSINAKASGARAAMIEEVAVSLQPDLVVHCFFENESPACELNGERLVFESLPGWMKFKQDRETMAHSQLSPFLNSYLQIRGHSALVRIEFGLIALNDDRAYSFMNVVLTERLLPESEQSALRSEVIGLLQLNTADYHSVERDGGHSFFTDDLFNFAH